MSGRFDIEKFDGKTSFALWQVRMLAILSSHGVKDAIFGRDNLPDAITDKKWRDMNDKALSIVQLCLSNGTLQEVMEEKTAEDLWEKLQNTYMKKSLTNRLRLKSRLYTLRMSEGGSVSEHISEFASIINDLAKIDAKVDDEDQALLLLCSLPASYKGFRDMMIYGREKISLEDVKSNLQAKSHIDGEITNEKTGTGSGLFVDRGRSSDRSSKNWRSRSKSKGKYNPNIICNYCKKKGHIKVDCYKLKNKQSADNRGKGSESANSANIDNFDSLSVVDNCLEDENCWIMDSGASQHMTPNRSWFVKYEPTDGRVIMGNNNSCKVAGTGTISLKFHDGRIRTLTGVKHIPDLKKNLISLGSLEERGCKFRSEGGVMRVSIGALTIMKAKRIGTLYFLQASTVTGKAGTVILEKSGSNPVQENPPVQKNRSDSRRFRINRLGSRRFRKPFGSPVQEPARFAPVQPGSKNRFNPSPTQNRIRFKPNRFGFQQPIPKQNPSRSVLPLLSVQVRLRMRKLRSCGI